MKRSELIKMIFEVVPAAECADPDIVFFADGEMYDITLKKKNDFDADVDSEGEMKMTPKPYIQIDINF